jgi:hypothetical protein
VADAAGSGEERAEVLPLAVASAAAHGTGFGLRGEGGLDCDGWIHYWGYCTDYMSIEPE